MSATATAIMVDLARSGPYPPSFTGSGTLFAAALFTLLLISMQGLSTGIEAVGNIMAQHRYARWRSTNLYYHLTVLFAAIGVTLRCGKEAAYMMAWGEATPATLELILTVGRYIDVLVVVPILAWMLLYKLASPFISIQLVQPPGTHVRLSSQKHRLWRFIAATVLIALISAVVAIGKV